MNRMIRRHWEEKSIRLDQCRNGGKCNGRAHFTKSEGARGWCADIVPLDFEVL